MVASYFKQHKPRSKVLLLDANPEIQSKKALFEKVYADQYKGIIEYRPNNELKAVDAATQHRQARVRRRQGRRAQRRAAAPRRRHRAHAPACST